MFQIHITIEIGTDRKPDILTRESWARVKRLIKKRDGAVCQICGKEAPDGEPDHVLALSRGGSDRLDNLIWICRSCNSLKKDKTLRELLQAATDSQESTEQDNPILSENENALVRFAVENLNGAFTLGALYDAIQKGNVRDLSVRISKRRLTTLAQSWEQRGWLTKPADAVSSRFVTPELAALARSDISKIAKLSTAELDMIRWALEENDGYLGLTDIQARAHALAEARNETVGFSGVGYARRVAEMWEQCGWLRKDNLAGNKRQITDRLRTIIQYGAQDGAVSAL